MAAKVVIENAVLRGSVQEPFMQRVATVYLNGGQEFRILAPAKASGEALEWLEHLAVHTPSSDGLGEVAVTDGRRHAVLYHVEAELKKRKAAAETWGGATSAGRYSTAQICKRGHVLNVGSEFERGEHCPQCGAAAIDACENCNVPIRGGGAYESTSKYKLPNFCHKCGRPYPWMADRLQTARELLYHDDQLTMEDREKLWDVLQYVLSNPKSDLVPAKKKLIEISLAKAGAYTREFVLDLTGKVIAEMSKP